MSEWDFSRLCSTATRVIVFVPKCLGAEEEKRNRGAASYEAQASCAALQTLPYQMLRAMQTTLGSAVGFARFLLQVVRADSPEPGCKQTTLGSAVRR